MSALWVKQGWLVDDAFGATTIMKQDDIQGYDGDAVTEDRKSVV